MALLTYGAVRDARRVGLGVGAEKESARSLLHHIAEDGAAEDAVADPRCEAAIEQLGLQRGERKAAQEAQRIAKAGADPIQYAKEHKEFARAFESFPKDADKIFPGWREKLGVHK